MTSRFTQEELAFLGAAVPHSGPVASAPGVDVAEGMSPAAMLATAVLALTSADFIPVDAVDAAVADVRVGRSRADDRLLRVEHAGWTCRLLGTAVRSSEGEVVCDVARGGALLVLERGEMRVVVRAGADRSIDVFPPEVSVPARDVIDVPGTIDWLEGWDVEDWLLADVGMLASSASPLDRVSAMGLSARLWSSSCTDSGRARERLGRGEPSPTDRARAWAASLDARSVERLFARASDRADALRGAAEALTRGYDTDRDIAPLVDALVSGREELESIAFVLRETSARDRVDALVRSIDDVAGTHAAALHELDPVRWSAHLDAVALAEPDAWWAQVGGGEPP